MATLTADQVKDLAHALHRAEHDLNPIAPLTEQYPSMDMDDAYAVQLEGVRERMERHGGEIVGWKIGLTSKAMQQMLNVDQPDFGHLLDGMRMDEGADITVSEMIWPRVEPEIAFQLKADLKGPGVTAEQVMAATEYLIPALEVIDSRVRDWKIKLCDTIADNASSAGWVLGEARVSPKDVDIKNIDAVLTNNGEVVAEGRSDAVLGNPVTAVAWLARKVEAFGVRLKAGDIVLPGSCTRAIDATPGSHFVADFTGLGSVRLSFE